MSREVREVEIAREIILVDKNGKVVKIIKDRENKPVDPFYSNIVYILQLLFNGTDSVTVTDIDVNSVAVSRANLTTCDGKASEGTDTYGLILYNGTAKILHGDGDNYLHYYDVSISCQLEGSYRTLLIQRAFENKGSVDVTWDICKFVVLWNEGGSNVYIPIALIIESVDQTIPSGYKLTYKMKLRFPIS